MTPPGLVLAHGGDQPLPPLTIDMVFTSWAAEPVVLIALVVAALLYGWGVYRLHRRGVTWSRWRSLFWLAGLTVIFTATSSSVGVYDTTLFSVHTVQHMMLQMFAPVPLALAAPVTLALRALPTGGRKALVTVLHSRVARVVTHPLVAFALFVTATFGLYYTPLYEATLRYEWLHNLNHVHFIVLGCLLYFTLLGLDPLPNPLPFIHRFLLIIFAGVSHVVLGIPIMMGGQVFAEDFYRDLGRTWGPTLIADQQTGGAILWALGDVTVMLFLLGFLAQWVRSDVRDARRIDRHLDRTYGDAETLPPWWQHTDAGRQAEGVGSQDRDPCRASPPWTTLTRPSVHDAPDDGERRGATFQSTRRWAPRYPIPHRHHRTDNRRKVEVMG
ncbi:MAG: cytochrome c oxidase assembly protein [Streptosporangiales bacterium]|nr:cytochrome c oxidase assembly protein [Streptosporangiales bacterium]